MDFTDGSKGMAGLSVQGWDGRGIRPEYCVAGPLPMGNSGILWALSALVGSLVFG